MSDFYSIPNPAWNPWANDKKLLDLYRRRCKQDAEEMTCAIQAAEILKPLISKGDTLLDVGCGGGYYYWSFANRGIPIDYHGIDHTKVMIDLARKEMTNNTGLTGDSFRFLAAENLEEKFDHVLCFNVLTNSPHYAQPLERMLQSARKSVLLRESMSDTMNFTFQPDQYLDEDKRHIKVYHNTYDVEEVKDFMRSYGFSVKYIIDERSKGEPEMVCDIPHHWKILLATKD